MYHYPNHDIYHPHLYQHQCPHIVDHSKNLTVFSGTLNNQFEATVPHDVVSTVPECFGAASEPETQITVGEKKKKKVSNRSCVDTSNFSIEERLIAAVWVHERKHTKNSMSQIKHDFRGRFGRDPPAKNTLLVWERKLFSTGSVHDAPRPGRPVNRQNYMDEVAASVRTAPALSLRARALALRLPRTTLRTILQKDLSHTLSRTADRLHTSGKQLNRNEKRQIRRKLVSQVDRGVGVCAATAPLAPSRNGYT